MTASSSSQQELLRSSSTLELPGAHENLLYLPKLESMNPVSKHNRLLQNKLDQIRESQSNIMKLEELYQQTGQSGLQDASSTFIKMPTSLATQAKFFNKTTHLHLLNHKKHQMPRQNQSSTKLLINQSNRSSISSSNAQMMKEDTETATATAAASKFGSQQNEQIREDILNSKPAYTQGKHQKQLASLLNPPKIQLNSYKPNNNINSKSIIINNNTSSFLQNQSINQQQGLHHLHHSNINNNDNSPLHGDVSSLKFKRMSIVSLKPIISSLSSEEEQFIQNNSESCREFELRTGETLIFLFKSLIQNLQSLTEFKSDKYCTKNISKFTSYNKKLKKLIDIENTSLKDFTEELLLQRYLSIVFKSLKESARLNETALHGHRTQDSSIHSHHFSQSQQEEKIQVKNNNNNYNLAKTNTLSSHRKSSNSTQKTQGRINNILASSVGHNRENLQEISIHGKDDGTQPTRAAVIEEHTLILVHDKQFLENILDLNSRIENWVLQMQKSKISDFQEELIGLTESVFDMEVQFRQQLMTNQKKQNYLELNNLIQNKYQLNIQVMKSSLVQQIRSCEEKNGEVRFIGKQNAYRSECIDKVITALERLDVN